jgi:hypothetical protein
MTDFDKNGNTVEESQKKKEDIHAQAMTDFDTSLNAENENRRDTLESVRFVDGEQWPLYIKEEREMEDRPCLTINKLRKFVKQMIGDIRQNKMEGKVRPVDNGADVLGAEVRNDLIRHIEEQSNSSTVYDTAAEQALDGGYGFWRIITKYPEDGFDQEIRLKAVPNRFSVYLDQTAQEYTYEDGRFAFVTDWITHKEFEEKYPDADPVDFEPTGSVGDQFDYWEWIDEDRVRLAEYFWKEKKEVEIAQIVTGEIVELKEGLTKEELEQAGYEVVRTRKVKTHKVMWCKLSGAGIIEGPKEIPSKYIPIVPVLGNEVNIEGRRRFRSLIYDAMDPMRMYNYWRSHATETIALAPKVPFLITQDQVKGNEDMWEQANVKNFPYLVYNNVPGQQKPSRERQVEIPTGVVNEANIASADIKDSIGMYESSLGQQGNERSGRAILARQREADATTYTFVDNINKSIVFSTKILLDMIPRVYDTERIMRLTGEGEVDRVVEINMTGMDISSGEPVIINDLSSGKYDYVPVAGPDYQTKRQEIAASMLDFLQFVPQAAPLIAPELANVMDWPGAQKIAQGLAAMAGGEQAPQGAPPEGSPREQQELPLG